MKRTNACPKCESKDILRIPGEVGGYGTGNNISMGWTIFSSVKVSRYLCTQCGYSEEWIDDKEDIERLKQKYGR
jgi:predicted RNA-binding Zn-ribbon protein involved in translation (DUF1610 family)